MMNILFNSYDKNKKLCIILNAHDLLIFLNKINNLIKMSWIYYCNFIVVTPNDMISEIVKNVFNDKVDILIKVDNDMLRVGCKITVYKYLVENKFIDDIKWILHLHTIDNQQWYDDLINPITSNDIINSLIYDKIDDNIKMISSLECKTFINSDIDKLNNIFDINLIQNTYNKNYIKYDVYWKYNIYIKYGYTNIKDVKNYYTNHNKNEPWCIYNYTDLKNENLTHYSYTAGDIFWISGSIIKDYLSLVYPAINCDQLYIIYNISEILCSLIVQLSNKKIMYVDDIGCEIDLYLYKHFNENLKFMNNVELKNYYNNYGINDLDMIKSVYDIDVDRELYMCYIDEEHIIPEIKNNNLCENLNNSIFTSEKNQKYLVFTHNYEGGSLTFLKNILPKLGECIIISPCKNNKFLITNNINLSEQLDENQLILLINKTISTGYKLFINSIVNFPISVKKYIGNCNKIIILHDYSIISDIYHPYYFQIIPDNCNDLSLIKDNDILVTQNYRNIELFNKMCPLNKFKNLHIYEIDWPDYYKSLNKIKIYSTQLNNLLVVGKIDFNKGIEMFKDIYELYRKKYNFYVAGEVATTYISQKKYTNLEDFNEILLSYNPNGVIFTSICPETWCYTLTLMMLAQLPIYYYDIGDCTTKYRLSMYNKSYPFTHIEQLDELFNQHNQNYFYTISDEIHIPDGWNNILNQ